MKNKKLLLFTVIVLAIGFIAVLIANATNPTIFSIWLWIIVFTYTNTKEGLLTPQFESAVQMGFPSICAAYG